MSTSEALSVIAQDNGKDSNAYRNACILSAYGRHADIVAKASAILADRRPGRILSIAA